MKHPLGTLLLPLAALVLHAPAAVAQDLDDAVVAHIAVTANQLDIAGAEQALERSSNAEVRAFAETMIRDHTGVIEQAVALAERLGVTPKDNETSQALVARAAETRERLADLEGAAFDRAYMENEITYHEAVITAVEETLVPATSNEELKQLLEGVVPALRAHLEHARRVSSGEPAPVTRTVEIRDMEFHPAELRVRPGDTVVWVNHDYVPHTATGPDSAWTSPPLAQDERWRMVARPSGSGTYLCVFHPVMEGRLIVDPSASVEDIP